jgi:hypothetical protein
MEAGGCRLRAQVDNSVDAKAGDLLSFVVPDHRIRIVE